MAALRNTKEQEFRIFILPYLSTNNFIAIFHQYDILPFTVIYNKKYKQFAANRYFNLLSATIKFNSALVVLYASQQNVTFFMLNTNVLLRRN